jgi:hypothetical protein
MGFQPFWIRASSNLFPKITEPYYHMNAKLQIYSVFQGFRQAKSANGGSILSLSQFFDTAPAASKHEARFKSGQS